MSVTYELLAWVSPQFVTCLCEVGVVNVVKLQVVTLCYSVRLCSHFFIGGSWFIYIYEQWHFRLFETRQSQSGRFYLLPKIHKVNNPGRSIVSANEHPTLHFRPHVEAIPSYLKDTTDYLLKWNPWTFFLPFFLQWMLCHNTLTSYIMTMLNGLGSKGVKESPTEGLVQLLTLILITFYT